VRPGTDVEVQVLTVVTGDITTQAVDAIVNAANSSLLGGGGVDGAIHRAGGPEILAACRRLRAEQLPNGLPTGEAVATTGGRLPASHVIHTVGPVYAVDADPPASLAACHRACLRVAAGLGVRTIAFPAISTGVYGYPIDEAAPIAVAAVRAALGDGTAPDVTEVRFVLFSAAAHDAFAAAVDATEPS
jgi:O-acetyl-ADP-ribose deacetylase